MDHKITACGVTALLDPGQGELRFSWGGIETYAADTLEQEKLFPTAKDWETGSTSDYTWAAFTVTGKHGFSARYRICLSHSSPMAAVQTKFSMVQDHQPIQWMHLTAPGSQRVSCLDPVWQAELSQLGRPFSFSGGLMLSGTSGSLAVYGREPLYDPSKNVIAPEEAVSYTSQLENTGLALFSPVQTVVMAFGGTNAPVQELLPRAGAFYQALADEPRPGPSQRAGQDHRFPNGSLAVLVRAFRDGAAFGLEAGIGAPEPELPLFRLKLRDLESGREFYADSLSGWQEVSVISASNGARFSFAGWGPYHELAMELLLRFTKPGRAEWKVEVLNGEQSLSVLEATYPPLPFRGEDISCLLPQHSGRVAQNVTAQRLYREGLYPDGGYWSMAGFAAFAPEGQDDNGLYFGLHDPDGAVKHITVTTDPAKKQGLFYASLPAPDHGTGGNAFCLPGKCVWESYTGGWYEAAVLYRDFVHHEAVWLPDVGPEGREDTPQWAKEISFWAMDWLPNTNPLADPVPISIRPAGEEPPAQYWTEEALKLREALGVPIGYHVYNWHWIPFNNDFPHYFPVKEGFAEGVKKLEGQGVHVMPYINARLWDTLDREDQDWQFTKTAKAWATKREDGSMPLEHYASHEPDGSLCQLASMCPSSGVWKKKMADTLDTLFQEYGASAVYMDQIAAAPPVLCMDRDHHHLPGGGSWWTEQYNLMLRRCGQIKKKGDGILTTEANAEVYIQSVDGLLTWIWLVDDLVPMLPLVYSGYTIMLGRNCNGIKKHDVPFFKYQVGQQLLYGQQIGWLNLDVAEDPERLPFLRKIVQLRSRYAQFFYKGGLLPPVEVSSSLADQWTTPYVWETKLFRIQPVTGAAWQLWDGSSSVLFLVNSSDEDADLTARVKGFTSAGLIEGSGRLTEIQQDEKGLILKGKISPNEALVIRLTE